ncbi:MAG: RagB/SusD family nutrient uptake outer membrane protein [Bacteroidales bacterium]
MKKYHKIIEAIKKPSVVIAALLMMAACERPYLEPWPPDGARTPEDVWNYYYFTRGFLDALYADHMTNVYYNDVQGYGMLASATDEAVHSDLQGEVRNFTNGIWNPTNVPEVRYGGPWTSSRMLASPWDNSFRGIRRVNIFLENVDNSVFIDDVTNPDRAFDRTHGKGQAYFWRAFLMFDLLQKYGPFPISTESLSLDDDIFAPRNTLDECFEQIITDCDSAIANLPLLWTDNKWYRANLTAAQALKSRVALYYASPLYQGDFETFGLEKNTVGNVDRWIDAANYAKDCIDDNSFYNLMSVTRFNRPFSNTNTYNNRVGFVSSTSQYEIIFSTPMYSTYQYLNHYMNMPAGVEGCRGYTNPTQEMVDAYEVVPLDGSGKPVTGATSEVFDWDNPVHADNPYANRDPRFYASINFNGYFWGTSSASGYYIDTYEGGVHRQPSIPTSTKTGYYYRKFMHESFYAYATGRYSSPTSGRIVSRLAEIILNYAEAMNEAYGPDVPHTEGDLRIGGSTAREAVNLIRARVNMPPVPLGLSQAEMRERIKHERRVELGFEGHRFYDLRRWKEGEKLGGPVHGVRITPTGFDVDNRPIGFTYDVEEVETRVWADKMYWWPIPYSEIVKYEGKLSQNPGWN